MPFILIGLAITGTLYFILNRDDPFSMKSKLFGLADIEPENQSGSFKRDYDIYFETVSNETGVPFALLKAHAVMESSLNPNAFRDENPSKRTDRVGWASRGLMQVLFWPGSDRFEKFGYTSASLNGGEKLFDPYTGIKVAALLIKANLNACDGNLRDAVNMYNAGVKESVRAAPYDYVNKVIGYYNKILGKV